MTRCRICGCAVHEFLDLGRQPLANGFLLPEEVDDEFFYRLAVGMCEACTMVQLTQEVPRDLKYHDGYPYHASGSATHRAHFAGEARRLLTTELTGDDPFIVEIGCNDGVMLATIAEAGVRHLGVEPAGAVGALAAARNVRVRQDFFDETVAEDVLAVHGPADVVFGANTICHIADLPSVLRGVDALLAENGVFVCTEPYLGTIVEGGAFDQIYDEHFYYFTARSVRTTAERFGFELVDVEEVPLHGGEIRYVLARQGRRTPAPSVAALVAKEDAAGLADLGVLGGFRAAVDRVRTELPALLRDIRDAGGTVVGYGAPGKVTTVTNLCGIGPGLVPFVVDSTPSKQGRLVPGTHIPVRPSEEFLPARPDHALLFAWNHAPEIMAKEQGFRDAGGRWVLYVPEVRVV